jgi:hypothetical protein
MVLYICIIFNLKVKKIKMRKLLLTMLCNMVIVSMTFAQLALSLETGRTTSTHQCYMLTLSNISQSELNLAGQNYRIFYDSNAGIFDETKTKSFLPDSYQEIKIVQSLFHLDASGFGDLPYESNMGFINMATDYQLHTDAYVMLSGGGETPICELCFTMLNGNNIAFHLAEEHLTGNYATAFNQVSQFNPKEFSLKPVELYIQRYENTSLPSVMPIAEVAKDIPLRQASKVSFEEKEDLGQNRYSNYTFDAGLGQYIILATPVANKEIDAMLLENHISIYSEINMYYYYFDNSESARSSLRKWINKGLKDATLYRIMSNGNIEAIGTL